MADWGVAQTTRIPAVTGSPQSFRNVITHRRRRRFLRFPMILPCLYFATLCPSSTLAAETLPLLEEGKVPMSVEELCAPFDPAKEPLEVTVVKDHEEDGIVVRRVTYVVGSFRWRSSTPATRTASSGSGAARRCVKKAEPGSPAARSSRPGCRFTSSPTSTTASRTSTPPARRGMRAPGSTTFSVVSCSPSRHRP